MQHSASGEGGWSEEDLCSCGGNSGEEPERRGSPGAWNRYDRGDTSSTPGQSSHSSSEHLSLLFGRHYNSPSSSSSAADWRPPRLTGVDGAGECDCAVNCPYSRSSGYHTMDAYGDELGSGPSRSLSRSTVLLTDCDDGYLENHSYPLSERCPSPADTLDVGSSESFDREWAERSQGEPGSGGAASPEPRSATPQSPPVGFDVKTIGKAVLTFRSALKGALRKLEGPGPEGGRDDSEAEAAFSPVRRSSETPDGPSALQHRAEENGLALGEHAQSSSPVEECSEASLYVDCVQTQDLTFSHQPSPNEACPSAWQRVRQMEKVPTPN
ncbi:uncharacterized protein FYW47_015169 [Aplochiton taeniatus]